MKLQHSREELKRKQAEMKHTEATYKQDKSLLDRMEKEVKNLETQMAQLNYNPAEVDEMENRRRILNNDVLNLQEKVDSLLSRFPHLRFNYKDPERNFDRSAVKGPVCKNIKLKNSDASTALEVVAGGKLYNVIVTTDKVGKQLLDKGQLQSRVTFIPLNQISSRPIEQRLLERAQQVVSIA